MGVLAAALMLSGCAGGGGLAGAWPFNRPAAGPVAQSAPPPPADPVLAFAARAQPGTQDRITLADGQPATARLVRAYNAASGRECREVAIVTSAGERARVICATPEGSWAETRMLLRGGGIPRP
ncbi:DVU3141 family protein [Falsiroseomonas ponticola]|uniref:DVU3141 family protein n=1 Tax=Falsiroseomonas ponticola TaxID=2786951 RepID=UPI0019338E1B|nr:DVU3141 family protein [Roseomonas ponticola]